MKKLTALYAGFATILISATPVLAYEGHGGGGQVDPRVGWNHLWHELMIDIWSIGIVFSIVAIVMLFKGASSDPEAQGGGIRLSAAQSMGWAFIPAFIFAADDFYLAAKGWALWNVYRDVPENAYEVQVNATSWQWSFTYENGREEDVLTVPAERPVVLRMTSDDVIHSFFLPHYRVKEDVMPGRKTYLWFLPHTGDDELVTCTEFCGEGHSNMYTKVVAMNPSDFSNWLNPPSEEPVANPCAGADTNPCSGSDSQDN